MRFVYRAASGADDDDDFATMVARITLTLLFGGLLVLGWRLLSHERPSLRQLPRRRRGLLTVEDAVRWRPEF